MRELVEQGLPLRLAQALADDLAGDLSTDTAEVVGVQLLVFDELPDLRVRTLDVRLVEGPLRQRILDLDHDTARAEDAHAAGVDIQADEDVLITGCHATIGGLDRVFDGAHKLLAGNALLRIELEERADEVAVHVAAPPRAFRSVGQPLT